MFSRPAISKRRSRAAIASLVVATVLASYAGMLATNSASQEYLCQLGERLSESGASRRASHLMPFITVGQEFHTSALLAESWPPLANEVSMAA